jgi:acetyltransferase-like isoleucine patch superfamily enzyme
MSVIEKFCYIEPEVHIGPGALLRSHTVIAAGAFIGNNFKTGNGAKVYAATIGDNVTVGTLAVIESGAVICDNTTIHTGAFVCSLTHLGEGVWIGPHVTFTNTKYPHTSTSHTERVGARVRRGARIGANATILPGVTIGIGALVGAGSVVVSDVPDRAVVAGNPAKVLRYL